MNNRTGERNSSPSDQSCDTYVSSLFSGLRSQQIYGDEPSLDGCPVAEGELESMVTGNTFIGLRKYYEQVVFDP